MDGMVRSELFRWVRDAAKSMARRCAGSRFTRGALVVVIGFAVSAQASSERGQTLDDLLASLRNAPSEASAAFIEGRLQAHWREAASPALRLLLSRAGREMSEGANQDAFDSFDATLDLDPDLINAWRGRAQARLRLGDAAGAIRDIQEALRREPRNFAGWQDLSRIAEAQKDWSGALAAWEKMLELDPQSPGGQERLKDLRRRALGERV